MQTYKSHAKINLFLDVISLLKNNYHGIRSIFAEVSLSDEIQYERNDVGALRYFDRKNILPPVNLLTKAGEAVIKHAGKVPFGIDFHIDKNIPIGGGLGGGSSNAAAVLKILNDAWRLGLGRNAMYSMAKSLGADVPFFINGGVQKVAGIGEINHRLKIKKIDCRLLLIFPDLNVETSKAYKFIDRQGLTHDDKYNKKKYKNLIKGLINNDYSLIINNIYNKFEEAIFPEYPELLKIRNDIASSGADKAFMTGSGSTLVGVYANEHHLADGFKNLHAMGYIPCKVEIR